MDASLAARLAAQKAKAGGDSEKSSGGACDNYRVDMAAANFGDCKCGFPKAAHSAATCSGASSSIR